LLDLAYGYKLLTKRVFVEKRIITFVR